MARGPSGKLVVELDPDLKDRLYLALATRRLTVKDWLRQEAEHFVSETQQPGLFTMGKQQDETQ